MAVIDELKAWAIRPVEQGTVVIKRDESINFIWEGLDSSIFRMYYNWKFTPDCVYYGENLVIVKKFGLFFVNEDYIDKVRELFIQELKQVAYLFSGDFSSYLVDEVIPGIRNFNTKLQTYSFICDELFTFIHNLNCVYEDKFCNYCKKLSIDQFGEVVKKHNERKKQSVTSSRSFDGIWYH